MAYQTSPTRGRACEPGDQGMDPAARSISSVSLLEVVRSLSAALNWQLRWAT